MRALPHPPAPRTGAFTLIEIMGVLGVMTILAMILAPALLDGYDRLARTKEATALEAIAGGFEAAIERNQAIPGPATFAATVATQLGWATADVTTNGRQLPRVILFDPGITNAVPIPYTQGPFGLTNTILPEFGALVISSLSVPLPSTLTNGFASSTAVFSNLWHTPENAVPSGWSWPGRGEDLRLQRLSIGTHFIPVIFNYDTYTVAATNRGRFTIGTSATNTLPVIPTYTSSYLAGSVIGLHHHAGTTNTLQVREVLQHPLSFVYERDAWRGHLFLGRGLRLTSGLDIQAAHDVFISAPTNVNAKGSPMTDQAILIQSMSNYMAQFVLWRDAGYPSSHSALNAAHTDLENKSKDLIFKPSAH